MRFVLFDVLKAGQLAELPGFADATHDVVDAVLEEAGKFAENELQPLNRSGDEEGCRYENGVVTTPKGFKEAYAKFVEGGWTGLAVRSGIRRAGAAEGDQLRGRGDDLLGQPVLRHVSGPQQRRLQRARAARHATEQKATYLPKLVDGTWSGTMCLTEPHCGTDLGLIKTKAEPDADGSYKITGTKIFISAGEHDLTENIVHLVLARLPDAPAGIRGISLFVVPEVPAQRATAAGRAQRGALRLDRAQDGHQGLGDLRDEFRRRARPGWSASRTRACAPCSP